MTITFSCILDETTDMEAHAAAENLRYAWQRWAEESCVEWNGGHLWELEMYHPEDDSYVAVRCSYCPTTLDDLGPDLILDLEADIAGVKILDGRHNSAFPLIVPVTVNVHWSHHSTPNGEDWDVEVIVEQRGSAREVTA